MANLPKSTIIINKPLLTCPACGKEIEGEAVISFDGDQSVLSGTHKTINLNGQVVGIKLQHDCAPNPSRNRGRPPGTKNKPKVSEVALQDEKSKAEAHRDRLREHETTQQA